MEGQTPKLELDSLTYDYPSQDDPNLQFKLSEKQEFAELEVPIELETLASRGDYYSHQKMASLFFSKYDYNIINHEPGTGKTKLGLKIGEELRKDSLLSPVDAYMNGKCNWIVKMYILTPGPSVAGVWKTDYLKGSDLNHMPDFYEIRNYQELYNEFYPPDKPALSDDRLRDKFNNSFIYYDEVDEIFNRSKREYRLIYDFYQRIPLVCSNVKIAAATGTLIIMSQRELGYGINLFPPGPYGRMPVEDTETQNADDWYNPLDNEKPGDMKLEAKIAPYVNGRISHLKNKQKTAYLVWPEGSTPINVPGSHSKLQVVEYEMTPKQDEIYRAVDSMSTAFNSQTLQASVFAHPSLLKEKNETSRVPPITLNQIIEYSAGIPLLLDIVNKNKGIKFIMSRWVEKGVNIIEYYFLKQKGFKQFAGKSGKKGRPTFPTTKERRFVVLKSGSSNQQIIKFVNDPRNIDGEYIEAVITSDVGSTAISIHNALTYIVIDPAKHSSHEKQRISRIDRPMSYNDIHDRNIRELMANNPGEYISYNDPRARVAVIPYYLCSIPIKQNFRDNVESIQLRTYTANLINDIPRERLRQAVWRTSWDAQLTFKRNQLNCDSMLESVTDCNYGFYPTKKATLGKDRKTYELLYGTKYVINELIDTIVKELSVDIDDFWNRKPRNINIIPFYREIRRILKNGGKIITSSGDTAYITRNGNSIFVQKQGFIENISEVQQMINPSTGIYASTHISYITDILSLPTVSKAEALKVPEKFITARHERDRDRDRERKANVFATWESFKEFLDEKNTNDKTALTRKIEAIENILIAGPVPENPFYDNIMRRYSNPSNTNDKDGEGGPYVFIIPKPVTRIEELSKMDESKRKTASKYIMNLTNAVVGEPVLIHIFRAQYNIYSNAKYTIYTDHTQAKIINILDPNTKTFIQLEQNSSEQLVYSEIISKIIIDRLKPFTEKMAKKGKKGQLWGAFFDPEMIFRINDDRSKSEGPKYTRQGILNKIDKARTKQFTSWAVHQYLDFFIFLGLVDEIYNPNIYEDMLIPQDVLKTAKIGTDWINQIKKEAEIIYEASLHLKIKIKTPKNAITNIEKERGHYYNRVEALEDGLLLYKLFQIYIFKKHGSVRHNKKDFADTLEKYFKQNGQLYYF